MLAGNTQGSVSFVNGILGVYDDLYRQLSVGTNPLLLELARSLNGVSGFYDRSCIFVPQGAYLGIDGLAAPTSGKNLIRLNVQAPLTDWEGALVEESCCCDDGAGSGPNGDCPEILDISPSLFSAPPPNTTLTIFGSGFRDGLAIEATRNPPAPPFTAALSEFTIIDANTATVEVQQITEPGDYTLTIFDPTDPDCAGTGQFTVIGVIGACPQFDEQDPVTPDTFAQGTVTNNVIIQGSGLTNVVGIEIRDSDGLVITSVPSFGFNDQQEGFIDVNIAIPPGATTGPGTLVLIPNPGDECPQVATAILITPGG